MKTLRTYMDILRPHLSDESLRHIRLGRLAIASVGEFTFDRNGRHYIRYWVDTPKNSEVMIIVDMTKRDFYVREVLAHVDEEMGYTGWWDEYSDAPDYNYLKVEPKELESIIRRHLNGEQVDVDPEKFFAGTLMGQVLINKRKE